jgi:hypothetical protein
MVRIGGWFRNVTPGSNFWDAFYKPFMEKAAEPERHAIRPTFIEGLSRPVRRPWRSYRRTGRVEHRLA